MGRCCSRPLTREEVEEETETRSGRLRALLRRLRPRGYSPLVEALEDEESLWLHGRSTSTAGRLVEGESRTLRESLGERESETELLQNRISELTVSLSQAQDQLQAFQQRHDETVQQKDEAETSSRRQVAQLEARISEVTESLSEAENELQALKQQHSKAEVSSHSHISWLQSQNSELTDDRSRAERELAALKQNCDELTAALAERDETIDCLRNQIAQLQEEISQCEAKISELTDGRAKVEEELQQREESEAPLHSQIAQLQEEISQREAKVSELTDGRAKVEEELQQREESEAALHSQIAQLQEEISQMESSLTAAEESRSQAESALAQIQQQHDLLKKKSLSESPQAKLGLRDLVNELSEVTDWFHFGLQLNVPFSQLMVIKRNAAQHDVPGKIYMLQEWLNIVWPEASWADIVAALVSIRMRGLAQRLAEKYDVSMPPSNDTSLGTLEGASHSEEAESTNAQLLGGIQRVCDKLDEQDKRMAAINASLNAARIDRQTTQENTLRTAEAVEDGQMKLESLADQEMAIKEQLRSKGRELHYLQQLQRQLRKNEELKAVVASKQKEIEQLQISLSETKDKLERGLEEVLTLRGQVSQARRELWASHSRVQELERERAELQAEMNSERREVEHTLIQKAAALPTQESAYDMMEYQHDQAMELLSESSGHEVTSRQEDGQREEQIRELLVRARKLESLRMTWRKCQDAPQPLARGSAAVDTDRHTVYFSDYRSIGAYEWQREEWSKLCDCPNFDYTLAVVGGLLTAVGGVQSLIPVNTLLSLVGDGSERRWEEHFPPMRTKREWTAVVCSGKHLVVMGGEDYNTLTTVEVLNTETRQWLTASSLPFPLYQSSATIVGDNIYLVGGCDRSGGASGSVLTCSLPDLLQSCQPHLLTSQSPPVWHQVADTPAYVSTCVTLKEELVIVGGRNSSSIPTDSVYTYDPVTDSWNVINHVNIARWQCLAVVLPGDILMVVGGCTSSSYSRTSSVEMATITV